MKNLLYKTSFLLIILLNLFLLTSFTSAQEIPKRTVKVAIYQNPPKIYSENGVAKGFWPDVINYIAEKENWEVEYVLGTWEQGLTRVRNNEVDMMVDVGYSGERAEIYAFTNETAFINWAGVYSRNDLQIESFADFAGKRIAVLDGDIHFEGPLGLKALMDSFELEAEYLHLPSYEDNFKAVMEGRADIAVVNRIFGTFTESKYDIKRTSVVFNPIELKFALPEKGDNTPYYAAVLDMHLKELKADSKSIYYDSIIKNLEIIVEPVVSEPIWVRPLITILLIIVFISLLIVVISRRYQVFLKQKVREKTTELLKSEIRYQELTDLLPQTVFETDEKGIIIYVNEIISEIFGYRREELSGGFNFSNLFSKADQNRVVNLIKEEVKHAGVVNIEVNAMRKDGSHFPAILYCSLMRINGKESGVRGIIADITEMKKIEKELSEEKQDLDKVMKSVVGREIKMAELKEKMENLQYKTESTKISPQGDNPSHS